MAVRSTVEALTAGRIEEANAKFCPTTAELGRFARAEQRRLDAVNRPPAIGYSIIKVPFKDWRIIHRQKVDDLKAQGWTLAAENLSLDDMVLGSKRRRWITGTIWFWAIAEAWSPPL